MGAGPNGAPAGDLSEAVLNASEDGIWTADRDDVLTSWNAGAERLFGYSPAEAIGRPRSILVPPEQCAVDRELLDRILGGASVEPYLSGRVHKDGSVIDVSIRLSALRDEDGAVAGVVAIARETTAQRRAEAALRDSEMRFQTLIAQLPDAIVTFFDSDHRCLSIEGRGLERGGRPSSEFVGRRFEDVLPPERAEEASARCDSVLTGEPQSFEWQEPSEVALGVDLVPVTDGEGAVVGGMGLIRDISHRTRSEREMTLQAHLLDQVEVAVIATDVEGRVTHWNRQAETVYGHSGAAAIGRKRTELARPSAAGPPFEDVLLALRAAGRFQHEFSFERSDGDWTSVLSTNTSVSDASGRVTGFVEVAVDVTERRDAEEDKRRLESQLHHAQKLEGIGRLAGGVAHDFNNLLAVIGNYAQFVEEAVDPGSHLQEDAAEIRRAAERGTALTRQLLVVGRRDAFEFETLDVNEVVSDIERLLRRAVGEETHLVVLRGTELPMARADRGHLEQVLLNLAINARDAMPGAGGTLTISTSSTMVDERTAGALDLPSGRYVSLKVSDTGTGMTPEVAARAFEPFFTTKGRVEGTGLGLSTVYGMVRQAGGTVTLSPAPGGGAAVEVLLPASTAPVESGTVRDTPTKPTASDGEFVLVVEDEPAVRHLTGRILRENGYKVVEAASLDEALATEHAAGPVDLLLTDVVMPGMSGPALADRVATHRSGVRTLFVSGYAGDVMRRHGLDKNDRLLLEKPFDASSLLSRVREALLSEPLLPGGEPLDGDRDG